MNTVFRDKAAFAIEVAEAPLLDRPELRTIDVWLQGRSLCADDNSVFVPTFVAQLTQDLDRLRTPADRSLPFSAASPIEAHHRCRDDETGTSERYWFLQWGETTDNVTSHLFRVDQSVSITSQFLRNHMTEHDRLEVLHATVTEAGLKSLLAGTIHLLSALSPH